MIYSAPEGQLLQQYTQVETGRQGTFHTVKAYRKILPFLLLGI